MYRATKGSARGPGSGPLTAPYGGEPRFGLERGGRDPPEQNSGACTRRQAARAMTVKFPWRLAGLIPGPTSAPRMGCAGQRRRRRRGSVELGIRALGHSRRARGVSGSGVRICRRARARGTAGFLRAAPGQDERLPTYVRSSRPCDDYGLPWRPVRTSGFQPTCDRLPSARNQPRGLDAWHGTSRTRAVQQALFILR
jgi:hypothetical protein